MFRRKLIILSLLTADCLVLLFSLFFLTDWTNILPLWPVLEQLQPWLHNVVISATVILLWTLVYKYFGLYQHRYILFLKYRNYRFFDILKATSLCCLLLTCTIFLVGIKSISFEFLLTLWISVTLGTLVVRESLLYLLRHMRLQGHNLRHVLIVGTNERAKEISDIIANQPELGYALRGYVDESWHESADENSTLEPIVSDIAGLGEYLRTNVVDEVIIALPIATLYKEASQVVETCKEQGTVVHFIPGFNFLALGASKISFAEFHNEPIITLISPAMGGWPLVTKRMFDLFVSGILIALLSPLLIIVSILVKLTSSGPIFFIQERVGLNKRNFKMYKFRTMVCNAEELQKEIESLNEVSGPVFKIKNDPRITPIGNFLRKTSIDELPQLFNVLQGSMSLVGPRPLPLRDYSGFDQDWYRRRFSVRPGVTCLWQIKGRSTISFEQWMHLDMDYIDKWSLWLDFKILLATVPAVLLQRGSA